MQIQEKHILRPLKVLALGALVIFMFSGMKLTANDESATKNIVILGDSLAAGYGIDPDSAFPALLQNKIDELLDKVKEKAETECEEDEDVDAISFDNVSCFYCPYWPEIAKEWMERERYWPLQEHITSIIKAGTFIVSKPRGEGEEHALEWRWSFSSAEITIAQLRSPSMKYCYFIFKSFFYQYFKNFPGSKSLPSYIAKTCMLHLSEQHVESWWEEVGITTAVLHLFKYLQQALIKR